MKRMALITRASLASVLALSLVGLVAAPRAGLARDREQTARGSYRFTLGDGFAKYVEFDARTLEGGGATGSLFLSDEAPLIYQDTDGEGAPEERHEGFYISASFDDMKVVGNQAVMSGDVRDSSIRDLIGRRVLLTVEDNGDNLREPDKLTWGVYRPAAGSWTPSDAELEEDPGVGLRWWATDAERDDDAGHAMPKGQRVDTQTFLLSAFVFVEAADGAGDILVQP